MLMIIIFSSARAGEKKIFSRGPQSVDFSVGAYGLPGVAVHDTIDVGLPGAIPVAGIGYRYCLSPEVVLRNSFGFSERTFDTPDTTGVTEIFTSAMGGTGIEYHFLRQENLSCYFAGLLAYTYGAARYENKSTKSVSMYSGSSYGINFVAGGEYFLLENVSVAAEYMLRLSLRTQTADFRNATGSSTIEQGLSTFRLSTETLSFILHCYL